MFSKKIQNFLPPITVEYLLLKQGSIGAQKWGWVHGPADWIQQTYVVGLAPHIRISIISCKWKKKSYKHDLSQIKKRRRSCEKKGQKVTFDFDTFFLDPEWHWWRLIRSDIGFDARWINICYFGYAATYLDETFVLGVKCDLSEKTKVQFFSEFDFGPEFLMYQHPCNFT